MLLRLKFPTHFRQAVREFYDPYLGQPSFLGDFIFFFFSFSGCESKSTVFYIQEFGDPGTPYTVFLQATQENCLSEAAELCEAASAWCLLGGTQVSLGLKLLLLSILSRRSHASPSEAENTTTRAPVSQTLPTPDASKSFLLLFR